MRHIKRFTSQFSTACDCHFLIAVVSVDKSDEKRSQNGQNNLGELGMWPIKIFVSRFSLKFSGNTLTNVVGVDHSDNKCGPKREKSLNLGNLGMWLINTSGSRCSTTINYTILTQIVDVDQSDEKQYPMSQNETIRWTLTPSIFWGPLFTRQLLRTPGQCMRGPLWSTMTPGCPRLSSCRHMLSVEISHLMKRIKRTEIVVAPEKCKREESFHPGP